MKITVSLISAFLLLSCNSNSKQQIVVADDVQSIKNLNSFEFVDSIRSDMFFVKDNLKQQFSITDLLVWGYQYNDENQEAIIYGVAYKPAENKYLAKSDFLAEKEEATLNGQKLSAHVYDYSYTDYHDFRIYLQNPRDLQKLRIFDSSEKFRSANNDYIDIIKINGTFEGIDKGTILIVNSVLP